MQARENRISSRLEWLENYPKQAHNNYKSAENQRGEEERQVSECGYAEREIADR